MECSHERGVQVNRIVHRATSPHSGVLGVTNALVFSRTQVGEAEVNFNQPARSNQMSEGVAKDYDGSAMLGRRDGREAKERPQ